MLRKFKRFAKGYFAAIGMVVTIWGIVLLLVFLETINNHALHYGFQDIREQVWRIVWTVNIVGILGGLYSILIRDDN